MGSNPTAHTIFQMKFKVITTKTFEFDVEEEEKRLKKCFSGERLERQMNLIELFKQNKLEDLYEAYMELPYNDEDEYPEQENVGLWFSALYGGWGENELLIGEEKKIEFCDESN